MADEEQWLALLDAEDVEGFNSRRTERTRLELFAADLAGKKLAGIDLSNANLEKSDLTGTDLTDANLMKANLGGIDASGAILREILGLRSRFKDAWLDGADLTSADLAQADLADANLERSKGEGIRLMQARLRGVRATGATWAGANLSEARLHQAIFVGADLQGADLTEVSALESDFSGARMDRILAAGAKFAGAKLVGTKLASARLPGANLSGADLTNADLAAADLTRANLSGANLTGAILRGAVLADANLEGATLTGADLADADLTGLDPSALGLDAGVVGTLSGFGVAYDESAPLQFSDVSIARNGDVVAVVWENPEGEPPPISDTPTTPEGEEPPEPEEPRALRFAVLRAGGWKTGVVPVPGEAVLDRQVVPWGDGFKVIVTRSRPEGAALITASLSVDGALGGVRSVALGYDPAVRPVLRVEPGKDGLRLRMYGLARRGPTFVVHDLTDGDPRLVRSDAASTARGFMKGQPVLACKGGVVMRVSATGPASPRRTPEGFPGTVATALPLGDDVLAVWAVKRVGTVPGGMRYSVIGRRHAPKEELLSKRTGVLALAALEGEEAADVYWVEEALDGTQSLIHVKVPGGEPKSYEVPDGVAELEVAPGVIGLVMEEGRLVVLDAATGKTLGHHP
ncbi:MAG: pentapeptide repeat-containing protein [Myxococcota bacterium]